MMKTAIITRMARSRARSSAFFRMLRLRKSSVNVDADVIVAMLVANAEGELDRDVYNGKKEVAYT